MLPAVATQSLPSLVQRAASQLASATSAAEVLEARDVADVAYTAAKAAARLAKAKDAHDEVIAIILRAQADALNIQAMVKCRIADEYDAAQERGEVAPVGKPVNVPDGNNKPTTADIGLSRKDIHEARQIRDAEAANPGVISRALDELLEVGEEPTKAAVRRAITDSPSQRRRELSTAGKELAKLRQSWREARPAVRQHFLTEITEREIS